MAVISEDVGNASSSTTEQSAGTQAPPPTKDLVSVLKSLDSIPLFMKDLPAEDSNQANGGGQDDAGGSSSAVALEALQSLAFDGTPDEVASNFKSQGNDYFVGKRYREALGFYTQALDAHPTDSKLLETLYANRAACNLELENYGATLRDTSSCLGVNPRNEKAFYRAARALLALDKLDEALDCCDHALEIDGGNLAVKKLKEKVSKRKDEVERREKEKKERERRKKELDLALKQAFLSRGLWLETSPKPPSNPEPAHFDPDSLPPNSKDSLPLLGSTAWKSPDPIRTPLILPTFFIYPQYSQSDFISHYHEDTPLSAHLDLMFPPESRGQLPWDTKGEYVNSNLNVYATTKKKRLLKIGKKLSLREVMDQAAKDSETGKVEDRDGMVMMDGILSLVVLPKGDAEKEWIQRFKAEREKSQSK
ncbi:hypothetical protein IE53DRAFT_381635 [Violaceomyces palustris]|uniref:Uncharacterized protein n=1 Tax=Violaceomyces palustris TaxID=1673888 RepID=A0ACD0NQJ2_9BASI|nr:hypothetical protein IE53DRAFT_381635 [Violaceomyces palustris]